jgi:hypothetical protein
VQGRREAQATAVALDRVVETLKVRLAA